MSVLYDFMPLPSKENNENAPRLYPKLIPYQTVSFNELTQKIAAHSFLETMSWMCASCPTITSPPPNTETSPDS